MAQPHSGLNYFLDLVSFDTNAYRVHYNFQENSGIIVPNAASTGLNQHTGFLNPIGRFWTERAGSGFLTGNRITIPESTGLASEFWTHLFIYEKTGFGRSVIVDTSKSGAIINSGYLIGITDGNAPFLECYNSDNRTCITSKLRLASKNLVAVTKANNNITFYQYDYNNQEILSDNYPIFGNYNLNSTKLIIGNPQSEFSWSETAPFSGFLDEYIYLTDTISPFTFRYFASGLASSYSIISGAVSGYSGIQVTGFQTGVTGTTGIIRFQNTITGSGLNPFGTGDYETYYGTSGVTGFLTSGITITPLTGYITFYITGDSSTQLNLNTGFLSGFYYDQITHLRNIDLDDTTVLYSVQQLGGGYNKEAGFDNVRGQFQLQERFNDNNVQLYLNGQSILSTGYSITGNFYISGGNPSGDYFLDGYYVDSTSFFDADDNLTYDQISGAKTRYVLNSLHSGQIITGQGLVFFNGILLTSGFDYTGNTIITNRISGESGYLSTFPLQYRVSLRTGEFPGSGLQVLRKNSLLFLNGQRQKWNVDYLENSQFDLIGNSGLFNNNLDTVYDKNLNFFET